MKAPVLESQRLILKPLSMEHCSQDYVNWLNDIDVYRYLETGGNYTLEMLKQYLKEVQSKDIYFWAIHLKENDLHIGNIKIDPINLRHGIAEYGIMMGKKTEWGKGFAKEATLLVIGFCFTTLKLRKVNLGVVAKNSSAINLYKKIGFETEGIYKNHGIYQDEMCDVIRMAIFNPNTKQDAR